MKFQGKLYTLNQEQKSLFEFIDGSKPGEYMRHYDKVVFHTEKGFIAAYTDDLDNYWTV